MVYNPVQSIDELQRAMDANVACSPAILQSTINLQSPLSKDEVDYLGGGTGPNGEHIGFDVFGPVVPPNNNGPASNKFVNRTMSNQFVLAGMRTRCDFILDAICVVMTLEPDAWAMSGTQHFGLLNQDGTPNTTPRGAVGGQYILPPSPYVHQTGTLRDTWNQTYTNWCQAQFEMGAPQYRAAQFAMQAFRLTMNCPTSCNAKEVLNERLVEMGNCSLGFDAQGYSSSERAWIRAVRSANCRLMQLRANAQVPVVGADNASQTRTTCNMLTNGFTTNTDDMGVFVPPNETQDYNYASGRDTYEILTKGYRAEVRPVSYGGLSASPKAYKVYRLEYPRIIRHDENLEIYMRRDLQDSEFFARFILEQCADNCLSPVPPLTNCNALWFGLGANGAYSSIGRACQFRLPFGQLGINTLLMGRMIDRGLCDRIYDKWNAMTSDDFRACLPNRFAGSVEVDAGSVAGQSLATMLGKAVGGGSCGCGG